MDPTFKAYIAKSFPQIKERSIQAVLELSQEGGTVPFIARYRKEKTGNLDEVAIRGVLDSFEDWQEVVKRKEFVLGEIEKQGNLTGELKSRIESCWDLAEVEEMYRPYKRKKKTKATLAREAGLQPLADWLWQLGHGELDDKTALEIKAKEFINPSAGYATYDEALRGAQHIIVEKLSNISDLRAKVRDEYFEHGVLTTTKTTQFKSHSKYEMYAEFREPVKTLQAQKASHRYLALKRGWQEGELKVSIEADEAKLLAEFEKVAINKASQADAFLRECAKTALQIHVIPSITNEIHRLLKDKADLDAIFVFAENLRKVLMASPFGPKVVLGVDPGIKTGCKLALLDKGGNFISSTVLHIQGESAQEVGKKLFGEVLKQIKIEAIAVGNGTGGREAERFVRKVLKDLGQEVPVVMVNESGASVYSASDVARDEFPELDITVRGAISIARRLQDPLAELVKIEPKSIGVGQYQHDVGQPQLKKSLHDVVESCVNTVGVDLNTASESLLQYVAGIGPATAKNIVEFRKDKGLFKDRSDLMNIPKFSSKGFEQAAGFLRVVGGASVLDSTGIHPERYQAVKDMAHELGSTVKSLIGEGAAQLEKLREKWAPVIGEFTFDDIIVELKKPGRDPRDPFKVFQFREDINEVADLKEGMVCPGLVTNVTNFGAFVDIGVHQDGLVHISQLSHKFVDDPRKVVAPGDQVTVKVLGVDKDKSQISLTMLMEEKPEAKAQPRRDARSGGKRGKGGPGKGKGGGKRPSGGKRPGGSQGGDKGRRPGKPFNNPFAALGDFNNKD
ncbi:MAG: RNA-binding transcriptional accessory protein [Bdellovibrionaceae bacterium]|nr:RNA-binding transcriptional accessory protein [Bdellovibrionales bacterium]MCB9085977.1 RNA-binding transcriptional accessory protein [Pseudobdellovibrionaceae bacterium]